MPRQDKLGNIYIKENSVLRQIIVLLIGLLCQICLGQFDAKQQKQFDYLRTFQLDSFSNTFEKKDITSKYFEWQYNFLATGITGCIDTISPQTNFDKCIYHIWNGDVILLDRINQKADSIAYSHYSKSLTLALKNNFKELTSETYKRLLKYHIKNQQDMSKFESLAKEYKNLAYDDFEKTYAVYFSVASEMGSHYYLKKPQKNIPEKIQVGIDKAKTKGYRFLKARLTQLLGVHYDLEKQKDIPLKLYKKARSIYQSIPYEFSQQHGMDLTFNISGYYIDRGDAVNAKKYLDQVDPNYSKKKDAKDLELINDVKYKIFKQTNKLDSAIFYLEKKISLRDSIALTSRANTINEFESKYRASEKEKENLVLQADIFERKVQQRNLLVFGAFLLIVGFLIAFLIHKNTKRKQYIAEQQREIEIQKTEKLLKEQEITSINAMIEGQEKERQRVASDLHDSVGATLAAAKLQFNHISKNKDKALEMEELFDKTEKLLADAYTEIRSMAHIKNSGVLAKDSLLPTIRKLAANVSINGNLEVEVQDFGLENKLENSLEITIFRIIQELITNIIKHSNATEASINITQHQTLLSIIVEDNGKGFNISEFINNPDGMGLSSIEKRVEHLEGTMEVDSSPGKGTTILIDLPI